MKLFVQKAGHDLITESETRRAQSVGPMYNTCVPESKNSNLISYYIFDYYISGIFQVYIFQKYILLYI